MRSSFDQPRGTEAWPVRGGYDVTPAHDGGFDKAILGHASSSKSRLRHKLLQPLSQPQTSLLRTSSLGAITGAAPLTQPYPGLGWPPRQQDLDARLGSSAPARLGCYSGSSSSSRPGTGNALGFSRPGTASRPRTAGGGPLPIGSVSFPAKLQLRVPGDAATKKGAPSQWATLSDNFVLPLETQGSVRQVSEACGSCRLEVLDGARLSLWALAVQDGSVSSQHVLEPLAARREDSTLAVEPVELTIERPMESDSGAPLRYGECFRLRVTDSMLYLGHSEDGPGLRWERVARREMAANCRGLRFAAHGGELGKPLLFGRPMTFQRVASPAPQPDSDSDSESEFSSHGSDSETEVLLRGVGLRPGPGGARAKRSQRSTHVHPTSPSPTSTTGVCRSMLLSRLADVEGGVSATMLPAEFALEDVRGEPVQTLTIQEMLLS